MPVPEVHFQHFSGAAKTTHFSRRTTVSKNKKRWFIFALLLISHWYLHISCINARCLFYTISGQCLLCRCRRYNSTRNSARQALAELFDALEPQKANWYCIKSPRSEDPSSDRIKALFPPMVMLLSMREDIFDFMVMKCGLMRIIRNKPSPSMNSWDDFRSKFWLHVELTTPQFLANDITSSELDHGALSILQ